MLKNNSHSKKKIVFMNNVYYLRNNLEQNCFKIKMFAFIFLLKALSKVLICSIITAK